MLDAVRDDVVFYACVDLGCDDPAIEEFVLTAVRPEANDARRPSAAQAGDLDELIERSGIDVNRLGCSGSASEARGRLRRGG
jgi:hypothetical protein